MSSDRIRLSVAEAREYSERALQGIGYDAEEARIIADHVIDAARCAVTSIQGSRKSSTFPSIGVSSARAIR
jgi:LDH2 family malate/lactate/ureidoglycolate dehydrogenase